MIDGRHIEAIVIRLNPLNQQESVMPSHVTIKGERTDVSHIDPDTPLFWALRDHLGLVGTKYGCGIAQCGACTV